MKRHCHNHVKTEYIRDQAYIVSKLAVILAWIVAKLELLYCDTGIISKKRKFFNGFLY